MKSVPETAAILVLLLLFSPALTAQEEEKEETYRRHTFSESETLFNAHDRSPHSRFIPAVSTFGSSGVAYYTLPSLTPFALQFGIGGILFSEAADRNFRQIAADESALALALYTGYRYNFMHTELNRMPMVLYASVLGGPVAAMTLPQTASIIPDFANSQFSWGGGVEGSLGTEIFFSRQWAGYLQVGFHTIGFTRPVAGESLYFGPTIGLGFGRVLGK